MKNINRQKILIFTLLFIFIFKLFVALSFNNSDWEPDSFMHFLELRTIFADFPNNLHLGLGVWTKPLYAYPFGFLVQIFNVKDLLFIQIINILISLLISFIVYKIVLKLSGSFKISLLSIVLTSFSLTLFKSSLSTLTDQIFGLMLILNLYFLLNKKYKLASLFVGLSVIGRIEGLFFVAIYNIYLILELLGQANIQRSTQLKKLLFNWVITIVPVFIWNLLGTVTYNIPLFIINGGYPSTAGMYGYGGFLAYPHMFISQEFVITVLFILTSLIFLKRIKEIRNIWFIMFIWITFSLFFILQSALWKLGIFGSAGLMRYFVGVIPFMVIIGAFGVYKLKNEFKLQGFFKKGWSELVVVLGITLLHFGLLIMHLSGIGFIRQFPSEHTDFKVAGEWIKDNVSEDVFLYSDRPETIYYSNRNLTNSAIHFEGNYQKGVPGVYVWSKEWGKDVFGLNPDDFKEEDVIFKIDQSLYVIQVD